MTALAGNSKSSPHTPHPFRLLNKDAHHPSSPFLLICQELVRILPLNRMHGIIIEQEQVLFRYHFSRTLLRYTVLWVDPLQRTVV